MRKVLYFLCCSLVLVASCTFNAPKPEELVGKHAFELLQQMDTISQEKFNSYFTSLEEMRAFVKDTNVADTFRNAILKVSPETHNRRLVLSYRMIKETGQKYDIEWQTIDFKEYLYQTKLHEGFNFQDGYLVFMHNEKEYVANIISFMFNEEQRLFNFSNFEPATVE